MNVGRPQWLPDPEAGESTFVGSVLRQETVGGAIALLAAVVAVVWANVDYASYQDLRHLQLGPLDVEHWAADGA
ncbi:MAG TPA: Na(+)/H(+) antiporter NhaA, partial [Marmoricola sp.]